jgi:tetratricopeptide (TPR) repeat protein
MMTARMAAVLLALLAAACARELRSANPDAWLELQSEHFNLRTDLPELSARRAIGDLELIRNALLAAGWHGKTSSPARIGVVVLASEKELHEFLNSHVAGVATTDAFGERIILVSVSGSLLESDYVKHEVTHALTAEYLVSEPRWVAEGIACYLETLDIDREKGEAVRGGSTRDRRNWLGEHKEAVNWSLDVMGMGAGVNTYNGYKFETRAWALVHWLVDTQPAKFEAFLVRLSHGESMWTAFAGAFPSLTEQQIARGMSYSFAHPGAMKKDTIRLAPWAGEVALRKFAPAEAHALRAELLVIFGGSGTHDRKKFDEELARAKAIDPANPLMLALSANNPDVKQAIDRHPEDWRSWELWFVQNPKDLAAIRKAAELAPANGEILARLALAEQAAGSSKDALEHAERAVAIFPGAFALDSLASVYEENDRCGDASAAEERAIEALNDAVDVSLPAALHQRLEEIAAKCGKRDIIGTSTQTVEAEPVLKICRQPLALPPGAAKNISAQFIIREDGTVTAVDVRGLDNHESGVLRQFVESCSFEPVVVAGKPRRVQLKLKLDAFLQ